MGELLIWVGEMTELLMLVRYILYISVCVCECVCVCVCVNTNVMKATSRFMIRT